MDSEAKSTDRVIDLASLLRSSLRNDNTNPERIGCLSDAELVVAINEPSSRELQLHLTACSECFLLFENALRHHSSDV
jgi:hypothetical protein